MQQPFYSHSQMRTVTVDLDEAGNVLYDAYCDHRDWKAFNGDKLPTWEQVDADIRQGWMKAGEALIKHFFLPPEIETTNEEPIE